MTVAWPLPLRLSRPELAKAAVPENVIVFVLRRNRGSEKRAAVRILGGMGGEAAAVCAIARGPVAVSAWRVPRAPT